ncbi:hypothetical protein DRW41_00595 [Neobacillus piezotolerans]|uniref:DUF4064 domain-containing protein n=1 Tax=Neobacillus piezotolerans TaxID=2259171 RepID=A0A3D8GUI3_9BACI|nr:hypothetical protein [Neobacillus piezotolerans]RDU38105.1 hypothetical protein DRW41_00595 [Neobacillus piezotolerans]
MKSYSILSLVFIIVGLLSSILNWLIEGYSEPIVLIGVILIFLGAVFGFIAIFKKEKGYTKFISIVSFFIILFLITWFEPLQVLRILTWLKNIV